MTDYCTLSEVKADLPESGLPSSTDYDAAITQMITDASRLMDNEIGRWPSYFQPSTSDETRYFDGGAAENGILRIDEMVSITSIAVSQNGGVSSSDYTAWVATDYFTVPDNYAALGVPIRAIEIDFNNGAQTSFYGYRKGVKIVGRFGWADTCPSPVARATKIQTTRWFMRAKQAYQDAGMSPELGQMVYVKKLDPDVAELLKPYILANLTGL